VTEKQPSFKEKNKGMVARAEKPIISSGESLRELFPEYAEMKHVFTGSLINKFLWKPQEKPVPEEEFRIYFL
jgi:hypothetical protein